MRDGQTAGCRAAGALAVVLFAWWATADGGYAPGAWYPGALLVLAALAGCVRAGSYRTLPVPARWALAAFAGFTVWSFCSIVRRPVDCLPIQGLGAACTREAGG